MHICKYCSREFKNAGGLGSHEPYCKLNPSRVQRKKSPNAHRPKGMPSWNKGLTGDPRCKHTEETKEKLKGSTGKASTLEAELLRKQKISEKAKVSNGGYRQGSGRGKKGWYRGFFCDSSYELAYLIYCLDNNIEIKRNTEKRQYIWEGKTRNYIPDFIVNGELVEIKGFRTEQWEAKINANPDIKVLYEKDLKDIFEYVINNYGKDYIQLYE
jgi:hypothetical protein